MGRWPSESFECFLVNLAEQPGGLSARTFAGVFNPASPFLILPSNSHTTDFKMIRTHHLGALTISSLCKDSGLGCSEICCGLVTGGT